MREYALFLTALVLFGGITNAEDEDLRAFERLEADIAAQEKPYRRARLAYYQLTYANETKRVVALSYVSGLYVWPRSKISVHEGSLSQSTMMTGDLEIGNRIAWQSLFERHRPERPGYIVFDGSRQLGLAPIAQSKTMYMGRLAKEGEPERYMPLALRGHVIFGERWMTRTLQECDRGFVESANGGRRFVYVARDVKGDGNTTPTKWCIVLDARQEQGGRWLVFRSAYFKGSRDAVDAMIATRKDVTATLEWLCTDEVKRFSDVDGFGRVPEFSEWRASYSDATTLCLIESVHEADEVEADGIDAHSLPEELSECGAKVIDELTREVVVFGKWEAPPVDHSREKADVHKKSAWWVLAVGVLVVVAGGLAYGVMRLRKGRATP